MLFRSTVNSEHTVKKIIEVSDHKTCGSGNANTIVDENFYYIMKFYNEHLRTKPVFLPYKNGNEMGSLVVLHGTKCSAENNGIKKSMTTSLIRKFAHTEIDEDKRSNISKLLMHKPETGHNNYDRRDKLVPQLLDEVAINSSETDSD